MNLVLASSSPYRKQQLHNLNINFTCFKPDVDETEYKNRINDPIELTRELAKKKAESGLHQFGNETLLLGADQLVELNNLILGKPRTHPMAINQLKQLNGQTHRLISSICLVKGHTIELETNITHLTMRTLDLEQISRYVQWDNPIDCAGSYKIEKHGLLLFDKIETDDHSAIMGLPILSLIRLLKRFDFDLL